MQSPDRLTLRKAILDLCMQRGVHASACPSEVARNFGGDRWRQLMPEIRSVAAQLHDEGEIVIMQEGEVVDPRIARGPIRFATRQNRNTH
ncbi:MAG TPA: DUF3253 domain-containing protein [Bryobacteraceae bacterium]|nr:DUF3253 domain-containing protein [Bryobacteraceae bacterium]